MKKLIWGFSIVILAALVYLDISGDYKEMYRIDSVAYRIFEISSYDKSNNCYLVHDKKKVEKIPDSLIIALRTHVKYLNNHKEWLWETFMKNFPMGGKGHVDTIKSIDFQFGEKSVTNFSSDLKDASSINSFKIEGEVLKYHSLNSWNMCGVPLSFSSIGDLIRYYNFDNKKTATITDYIFFKIDNKDLIEKIYNENVSITFNFQDKTIIKANYTISE